MSAGIKQFNWKKKMLLTSIVIAVIIFLLVSFLGYCSYRYNQVMRIDDSVGINESMYVPIGETSQWVQIRGRDRNNPVILWLNGGPGFSTIPQTFFHRELEEHFTVVMWDQRGEGKSFAFSGPDISSTMTVERMAADGIELTKFIKQQYGFTDIWIMGHSWGSILGVRMAHLEPELFSTYIGTGQIVNLKKAMELEYPSILRTLRDSDNKQAFEKLDAMGPPPYERPDDYIVPIIWANAYDAVAPHKNSARSKFAEIWAYFKIIFLTDKAVKKGMAFSQEQMLGAMLDEKIEGLGLSFEIPIIFIQGSEDKLCPTSMVEDYFQSISAPKKKFIVLEDAGHLALLKNRGLFREVLLEVKSFLYETK